MRKKIFLSIFLCAFCLLFTFTTINVNAQTIQTEEDNIEVLFPGFKEDLLKYSTGELLNSEETYIRFKLKDEFKSNSGVRTSEDFNAEYFSKEEYELERIKENNLRNSISRGIGSVDTSQEPYWLRISFEVYQGNTSNKFRCYSFASWKTRPAFTFTDGHGISTTDGMYINNDPFETQYMYMDSYNNVSYTKPGYIDNRYGVVAKIDLRGSTELQTIVSHNSMVGVTAQFSNETPGVKQSGKVFTEYLHKQVSLGSIGIDADGTPNLSLSVSSDSYSLSCQVSNY